LEKYDSRMQELQAIVKEKTARYQQFDRDIENSHRQLGIKMTEEGKHQAEKASQKRQIEERETLVKEIARRHNFRGFDTDLDENLIRDFMGRLAKTSREQTMALERVKQGIREELKKAQAEINALGERRSALTQMKDSAKLELSSYDRKAADHLSQLNKIEIDEGGKAVLDNAVSEIYTRLDEDKGNFQSANYEGSVVSLNRELDDLDSSTKALQEELFRSTQQAGDLAKLQYVQQELKNRRQGLETMQGAHNERLVDLIGSNWRPETLEQDFDSLVGQKESDMEDAERQRNGVSRELEQIEFKFSGARDSLKKKRAEVEENELAIKHSTNDADPSDYLDILESLEQDRDVRRADVDNFANLRKYYEGCLQAARANKHCRLCRRDFPDPPALGDFITRLEKLASKGGQESVVSELKGIEEELSQVKNARPSYDLYTRLQKTEIPVLEAELQKLEQRRGILLAQLEDHDCIVSEIEAARKELETISKTVRTIAKYSADIHTFENQVADLSSQNAHAGLTRTSEDIKEQLTDATEKSRALKRAISKTMTERDRAQNQINRAELEVRDISNKIEKATYQLREKTSLMGRMEEMRAASQQQREAIHRADEAIKVLAPDMAKAHTKYDDINHRGLQKEKDLQQEASKLSDSLHHLRLAEREINSYIDKGGESQLLRCQSEVKRINDELARLGLEQREVVAEVNTSKSQLEKNEDTKRTIRDNLHYRQEKRALATINEEIAELEAQNAERDRDRYVAEAKKVGMKLQKLNSDRSSKTGAAKSKDDELQRLIQEWETDYKDSAQKYKEAHIKVEVLRSFLCHPTRLTLIDHKSSSRRSWSIWECS
jgi:DNA repair protein RAD50